MGAPAGRDDDLAALEDLLGPSGRRRPATRPPAHEAEATKPAGEQAQGADAEKPGHGSPAEDHEESPPSQGAPSAGAPGHDTPAGGDATPVPPVPADIQGQTPAIAGPHWATNGAAPALSALDPWVGLGERIRRDRFLTGPVQLAPRVAAIAGAALLAVLWVLSLRSASLGRPGPWPPPILLAVLAVTAAGAGVAAWRLWPERTFRLRVSATQRQERERIERQVQRLRQAVWAGAAAALLGLLALGTAYGLMPSASGVRVAGVLLVGVGGVLALGAAAAWAPLRLLYLQTLVLERLESMGIGSSLVLDPRTADVILALDRLLGQLPESSLRQFMSLPEAQWYLDLIHRLRGRSGGG